MEIQVKALPIHDVLTDLSKTFNTPIEEDSGELTIHIPSKYGEGFIRGSSFDSGIGIIEYQCTFYQNLKMVFTINKTHPLKFIFCSQGRIEHAFEKDEEIHIINSYQNCIVSSSGKMGHVLYFRANETVHVSSLEIIRKDLQNRNNYHFAGLDPRLKELLTDSDAQERFYYQGNYSIKSADIVEQINQKEYTGFLRSIFLEGKLFDMLVLQITQYQDDQQTDKLPQILRRSDVEKVNRAVEIINSDLTQNYTVDHLAKEVGTNVNKLQDGFKYMFNLTVNKYMQQAKLEKAKEFLTSSEYNISQIVALIGLNNRSYFSKIFKEKYGVSPKYFLTSRQEKDEDDEDFSSHEK